MHPSASGEAKVGALLTQYFDSEASAGWLAPLAGSALQIVLPEADAYVDAAQPTSNFGGSSQLRVLGGSSRKRVYLRFNVGSVASQLIHAKLVVRDENTGLNPVIALASNSHWDELSINYANAPAADGGTVATQSNWTRENCPSFDLSAEILADADGVLTVVIDTPAVSEQILYSRETSLGPRLILSLRAPADTIYANGFE